MTLGKRNFRYCLIWLINYPQINKDSAKIKVILY